MAVRRLPLGLLAPVSLVILVVALGALQYRWVGQVSEADRAQLRNSLDRRAREFAEDFDRQIGRAYDVFRLPSSFTIDTPDVFAKKFDDWHATAPFAGLVRNAYYAAVGDRTFTLSRFDPQTRTLVQVEWPRELQPVQNRLLLSLPHTMETGGGKGGTYTLATTPVLPDVPAVLIPQPQSAEMLPAFPAQTAQRFAAGNIDVMVRGGSAPTSYAVIELDKGFIRTTLLPALVDRHFADSGADRFKVSVLSPNSEAVLTRGLSGTQTISDTTADATVPFFGIRFETLRVTPMNGRATATMWTSALPERAAVEARAAFEARGRGASENIVARGRGASNSIEARGRGAAPSGAMVITKTPSAQAEQLSMIIEQQHATAMSTTGAVTAAGMRVPAIAGWRILIQHAAGSLDAAVASARRRNLWLSFGILGVLATSTFLVLLNARRSEKLAAQQMDFVATVSHELRTPVAVIRSAAQNLSAGVVHDAEQAKRYGDLIDTEGRRLTDMVEQVLEYAGLSGNRRPAASRAVDVASLVHDVVNTSHALPESRDIAFEVRVDEHVPPVMADQDALRRAILNLVSNALKYADDGRWVGIAVTRTGPHTGGEVQVSVTDRGRGIPADDLAHIFEPFYRGRFAIDQQIHGNGLGLSLVKRIAEAHGGRVTVKSTPGQGSTFTITLPAASGAAAQIPQVDLA